MTEKHASLGLGITLTALTSIASRMLAVFVNLIIIKILSPEELGLFLGVQAMVYIGSGFCDLGLSHGYRQMASRSPQLRKTLLGPTVLIQFLMLSLYFFGLLIYLRQSNILEIATIYIAIGALLSQWPNILSIDLYIVGKFREAGILQVFSITGMAIGTLFASLASAKLLSLTIGYSLGMLFYTIAAFVFVGKATIKFKFTRKILSQFLISVPFFCSIVITKFGLFFALTYLLTTKDSYSTGIIGFPMKIYQICLVLSSATTSVTLPRFHNLAQQQQKEKLGKTIGELIGPLWVIMGCIAGVCFLFPDMIVQLVGNNQYAESAFYLKIFSVAVLFKSLSIPAGNLLESRNLQWLRVLVQLISSSTIVFSVLFLFPQHGLPIIAYSVLAADMFSFFLLWGINAFGMLPYIPWRKHIVGSIALAVSLLIAWRLRSSPLLAIPFFLVTNVILAILLNVWNPQKLIKIIHEGIAYVAR